jgi:hypothetical protein
MYSGKKHLIHSSVAKLMEFTYAQIFFCLFVLTIQSEPGASG